MSRPLWVVSLLKKAFPGRFFLAKVMRRLPVLRSLTNYLLFRGDVIIYLPKDHVIKVNEVITQPQNTPLPSEVVAHFIERADDLWIMNTCICREAAGCQDYPVDLGCLFMG
ncbi:MAG: 4Fe-4S ferredoxin, partial [Anaerolineales bacterium]